MQHSHSSQGSARQSSFRGSKSKSFSGHGGGHGGHSRGRSFGAPKTGGYRGRPFGNRGRGRGGPKGERIDVSKFINKTIISEEVEVFTPEHMFADFHISDVLKKAVIAKGYKAPTPIQDRAIPHVLKGTDVVGIANTGTGKTAAFLIPLINKMILNPREQAIIIVPTRELAIQIDDELKGFTQGLKGIARIFSVCCVGGAPIGPQIRDLKYHNNFVIGTPGRLKDLIDRKLIRLAQVKSIVLDEADRMLDMGFIGDMRLVMAGMPKDRQTLFFSATLSPEIEKLIGEFLREPVRISVKTRDTSKNVEQDIVRVEGGNKLETLYRLLAQEGLNKVLIFGRTKHGVEKLSTMLAAKGFKAESIHGDKNHSKRQKALGLFKQNHVNILVATDVAARGLDISDISHVINYDLPATYDDYVHRIGRTGRGTKRGKALTFID